MKQGNVCPMWYADALCRVSADGQDNVLEVAANGAEKRVVEGRTNEASANRVHGDVEGLVSPVATYSDDMILKTFLPSIRPQFALVNSRCECERSQSQETA